MLVHSRQHLVLSRWKIGLRHLLLPCYRSINKKLWPLSKSDLMWSIPNRPCWPAKTACPNQSATHRMRVQQEHSHQIRQVLKASNRVTDLEVSYPDLVANPTPVVQQLAQLLEAKFTPNPTITAIIEPSRLRPK